MPLLSHLAPLDPPPYLLGQILHTIESVRMRTLYTRVALVVLGFALVTTYIVNDWVNLWAELSTSSFVEFLRLAVSDPDVILTNIKDVLLGLLETLPVDVLLTLLVSSTLAVSLIYLWQIMRDIRRPRPSFTTHLI